MVRGAKQQNAAVGSILKEGEQNLLAAFQKSSSTSHHGLKGDARAQSVADFLQKRLPSGYGILTKGEVVDYLDQRSGEIDIVVFDRVRNAVLSDDPLWVPVESLLAYVEVKSVLTEDELRNSYIAARRVSSLRPFKTKFSLADGNTNNEVANPSASGDPVLLRCFRTVFAYTTNLTNKDWLTQEWNRVIKVTSELQCNPALIDRVLVLDRGMINPPFKRGTDESVIASVFQQWFINLVNFLARENGRRPPVDWQTYTKQSMPGWKSLAQKP